jgi:ABC-type Fe3+/spermidine/putrescine transport system ATPase subunit
LSPDAAIEVEQLHAGYGQAMVLQGIDLRLNAGEFMAVLGSSGCGKTTLLRAIAGFQPVASGQVRLMGREVTQLPPEKRDIAMVFQSYALWPHMDVAANVGYGLKLRGWTSRRIAERVETTLALLGLSGMGKRPVTQLSGGQRQRVALGRALAVESGILLLDEPLSNLDAKVRMSLRYEMKALQRRLQFAALHVTHDREEAMSMADRILILDAGRIAQLGTPEEVYDRPCSDFVASFMGADNRLALAVQPQGDSLRLTAPGLDQVVPHQPGWPQGPCEAFFRAEDARLAPSDAPVGSELAIPARVTSRAYLGGQYRHEVETAALTFAVSGALPLESGSTCSLRLPLGKLHVFPATPSPPPVH